MFGHNTMEINVDIMDGHGDKQQIEPNSFATSEFTGKQTFDVHTQC